MRLYPNQLASFTSRSFYYLCRKKRFRQVKLDKDHLDLLKFRKNKVQRILNRHLVQCGVTHERIRIADGVSVLVAEFLAYVRLLKAEFLN